MTNKNLFQNTRGKASSEGGLIFRGSRPKSPSAPARSFVSVRPPATLPEAALKYFKKDPRSGEAFSPDEKRLNAQVAMHELDEGCRLLHRAGRHQDAEFLARFSKRLHFNQRLELLRLRLEEISAPALGPEKVAHAHKVRNNQWGALQTSLGEHPAVAITQQGIGYKDRNEDAFLIMQQRKIAALADGMGGHVGGEIASGIAVDFFEYGVEQGMEIDEAIAFANRAILARTRIDERLGGMHPMGCTFAAARIEKNLLKIAHVGDTKALVFRKGKIHFQTQDHTQGQQLLSEGLVDVRTAFELNHILNRCLGMDVMRAQRDVSVTSLLLEPGDRILLATDGLTDNYFDTRFRLDELEKHCLGGGLLQCATSLMESCLARMNETRLPDGRPAKCDNITLALIEFAA